MIGNIYTAKDKTVGFSFREMYYRNLDVLNKRLAIELG